MGRGSRARHALPSGRRELEHAYHALVARAAAQRAVADEARLEVTRLLALTEGLTGLVTRLSGELSDARRSLERRPEDGRVALLSAQVEDLRVTVHAQQDLMTELTRSIGAALAVRPAEPAPTPAPAPAQQLAAVAYEPPVVTSSRPEHQPSPGYPWPRDAAPDTATAPPSADEHAVTGNPVEDETVLRLRLIRQAFER